METIEDNSVVVLRAVDCGAETGGAMLVLGLVATQSLVILTLVWLRVGD